MGKSLLLKLIGGVLIPDAGELLIPPHLRVLHISQEPVFFHDTLYANLTYCVMVGDPDGDPSRVLAICHRLKVSDQVCLFLDPGNRERFETKAHWNEVLSMTQRVLLN